ALGHAEVLEIVRDPVLRQDGLNDGEIAIRLLDVEQRCRMLVRVHQELTVETFDRIEIVRRNLLTGKGERRIEVKGSDPLETRRQDRRAVRAIGGLPSGE